MAFLVFLFGLVIGSFLAAFTYRRPRNIAISKGRSFCPNCKHSLAWYDNIPLFSYLYLRAKCRYCKKPISPRYFLIELSTGILFLISYLIFPSIVDKLPYLFHISYLPSLISVFLLIGLLVFIFVVDFENQLILDESVWFGFLLILSLFFISGYQNIWLNLLGGFLASLALLFIYFATRGGGMGLGDVKFALLGGTILGIPLAINWLLVSFIIGGIVGVILLLFKFAKLKDKIAFGPFLVIGFLIVLFL